MRKEERKKAEKEKLLQETDPDKTRKWEVWRNLYFTNYNISLIFMHNYMCCYSGEGTQESSQETVESKTESDACRLTHS